MTRTYAHTVTTSTAPNEFECTITCGAQTHIRLRATHAPCICEPAYTYAAHINIHICSTHRSNSRLRKWLGLCNGSLFTHIGLFYMSLLGDTRSAGVLWSGNEE